MDAELIAVGSELLLPGFDDTNSAWIADRLGRLGIDVRQISIVPDDVSRIAEAVSAGLRRSAVVLVTGGLGPTEDDRTRSGVARALGLPLTVDPEMRAHLETLVRSRGRVPTASHVRQAERPSGVDWIPNPVGTAPGLRVRAGHSTLFVLPGVPAEMKAMFELSVWPVLRDRSRSCLRRRTFKIAGRMESSVDAQLRDLYSTPGAEMTILAKPSGIELRVRVEGSSPDEADATLSDLGQRIEGRLGDDLYGRDDDTLPSVVGAMLRESERTVATAESCTAGLLSAAVTSVPGSSAWYRGGLVVYANDLKLSLAEVPEELIAAHGAVSAPVARALANGARTRCRADLGIGITGIAGPTGGDDEKPVGLVHIAVADADGVAESRSVVPGDRDLVRRRAVTIALDLLRRRLLESP